MTIFSKPSNVITKIILLLIIISSHQSIVAQLPAFPTAYGAGAYASGGRGGIVVHVTNLNDRGSGSLREALGMRVPRTIVFDVSGVITLESILYVGVHNSNVTIAGQTAPEGGITIVGHRVYMEDVDNLICRYIRFRGGITAEGFGYDKNDSLTVTGNITNQIFDHCSFSYDGDETADWSTITNGKIIDKITVQRSIFGEGDKGVLFGGQSNVRTGEMSLHHSLFYNITHRTPNVAGYNGAKIETINNVVWTISSRLVRTDGNPTWNHINNYYNYGNTPISDGRLNMQTAIDSDPPKIYTNGNKIVSQFSIKPMTFSLLEINENNKLLHRYFLNQQGHLTGDILNANYFTDTQHPLLGRQINTQSADDAFKDVTTDVGCNARLNADGSVSDNKDVLDAEWLNNIAQGKYVARSSPSTWVVPAIPSRTRSTNFYISNPHIPEIWFQANVPSGQDHNAIAPSGYTWLEEYLNQVDRPKNVVAVQDVKISPEEAELEVTKNLQLSATFTPSNATNKNGVWTSSDEDIATVDGNGLVTAISVGEVTITFTSADGGIKATSLITAFREALQASAGSDQQICIGSSITLTASGGTHYVWDTGETTKSIEVSPEVTTTYTVVVSDDAGQSDEASVIVTVKPLPIVNAGSDITIEQGESAVLTATGATSYKWSNDTEGSSITVSPSSTRTYTVTGISNGCEAKDTVRVVVLGTVEVIADAGKNKQICEGSSATLTATGGATYLWDNGATTASITVSPNTTTKYSVTAFDSTGKFSDTAEVTVTVNPIPVVNAGKNVTIYSGESTTLTATGATSYKWDTGATGASIQVSPNSTTTYTVTGVSNGCEATSTVTVVVLAAVEVIADAGKNQQICEGSSATLTATGGATYLWDNGATTASITVSPSETTKYSVTAYDSTGKFFDNAEVTVTVNPLPIVSAGKNVTINAGESTILTATGATSYKWNTGATGKSITVSPTTTQTYSVTGTSNGCQVTSTVRVTVKAPQKVVASAGKDQDICQGGSVKLTATGGETYLWSTGAKTPSITVSPKSTAKYSVTAYVGDVSAKAEVVVNVTANPKVKIANGSETSLLKGERVTLSASGAKTYKWNNGAVQPNITVIPNSTQTYKVTGFNDKCAAERSVKVNVLEKVVASAGKDVTIYRNEKTVLTATGPKGSEYLWSTGETTKSITVSPEESTVYSVMVYHALDSDTANVTVNVIDLVDEDILDDSTNLKFLIHPNPTNGELHVKVSGLTYLSSIHLYDLSGKSLYSEIINESDHHTYVKTLNLSNYATGIYLLQLVNNNSVITKKVVLR